MTSIRFQGKGEVFSHHAAVPFRALKPNKKKSVAPAKGENGNLIIHGDNLEVLKALLPRYEGRVNCVYIDPPYNTGNEGWVYNDKVNSPLMREWLGKVVDSEDQCRHDKWMCMMWPRLNLLRDLLADDGVIFISIDDNEQYRLRAMMDEIFGEENFVANVVWRKKAGGGQDSEYFAREHDYQLCYRKSPSFVMNFRTRKISEADYPEVKNGKKCKFLKLEKWGSNALRSDRPTMFYSIKDPDGKNFYPKAPSGEDGNWRTRPTVLDDKHIHWKKNRAGRWTPYEVIYMEEANKEKIIKDRTIFYDLATTTDATEEQKMIFGKKVLDNSKPVDLIYRLIRLGTEKDSIILDSFAGSGTTAHAVLALNKEDGGNRKFILVECEDYADRITAERVRRVIKGVPKAKDDALRKGLGGDFTYCTLGETIDADKMLIGESMPSWETLARHVFWTATGAPLEEKPQADKNWFVGKYGNTHIHLLYKPDASFLRGKDAALTEKLAKVIAGRSGKKEFYIFAPMSFLAADVLWRDYKIRFCQLPWAVYERQGGG